MQLELGVCVSEAARHHKAFGHPMTFGCCKGSIEPMANLGALCGTTLVSDLFLKRSLDLEDAAYRDREAPR